MTDCRKNWQTWQAANLAAIQQRLSWLHPQPDGVLLSESSGIHWVTVTKQQTQIHLTLVEKVTANTNCIQSWLDLNHPTHLVFPYTQAMMLGLLWNCQPQNIYLVGFGGGTVPLFLHHYFPEARIESTDIDPIFIHIATQFFGVAFDERLQVTIQEGREYLAQKNPDVQYDIILLDAAFGNGYMPYQLATQEFYQLCRCHLRESGVLVINLLEKNGFVAETVKTLQSVFAQVYVYAKFGNHIFIATNAPPLTGEEIITQAGFTQQECRLSFSLFNRARDLKKGSELLEMNPDIDADTVQIFTDAAPPAGYFSSWLF